MPYVFKCMQYLTMRDFIDTTGQVVCVFSLVSVLICKYVSVITCAFIYPCLLSYVCCDDILYTWQVRNDFDKDVYKNISGIIRIDDGISEEVGKIKFLGAIIDHLVNWKDRGTYVIAKYLVKLAWWLSPETTQTRMAHDPDIMGSFTFIWDTVTRFGVLLTRHFLQSCKFCSMYDCIDNWPR